MPPSPPSSSPDRADAGGLPHRPERPEDGHKGTFGTVVVVGGCGHPERPMIGAPALAALAALRAGCGLAAIAAPLSVLPHALTIAPCATGIGLPELDAGDEGAASAAAERIDGVLTGRGCIAIGPGWGVGPVQAQILTRLLAQGEHPLVLDADAITVLAALPRAQLDFRAPAVLTPHPGEYRRLAQSMGIAADPTGPAGSAGRTAAAELLAQRLGCVVVLKGAGTVISDGATSFVNATGNSALATAGSGDVLTGMIAGLVAQHFLPNIGSGAQQVEARALGGLGLLDCARLAVHAHGAAADDWRRQHVGGGMLATDLLDRIPAALG